MGQSQHFRRVGYS